MTEFDPDLTARPGETTFQWARRTGQYAEVQICTCCMIIEANGDACGNDECDTCRDGGWYESAYAAGWHGAPFTVTLGAFTDECGHDLDDSDQAETHSESCERFGFTVWSCELCESPLHGDRYAAVIWPRVIPDRYRYAPVEYVPDPAEHLDVNRMRIEHATRVRAWVRQFANDPAVSDTAFTYTLHTFTYELARDLVKYSLSLMEGTQA